MQAASRRIATRLPAAAQWIAPRPAAEYIQASGMPAPQDIPTNRTGGSMWAGRSPRAPRYVHGTT